MSAAERLIRYCKIDTQSDPEHEDVTPSTEKQFDLARVLVEELKDLGLCDVELDAHCYVYGKLPSNVEGKTDTVGFIAHMDTAPDFSGSHVNPRIIENFDGNDIQLNADIVTSMEAFPYMRTLKGKTLIVTDGTTLLGADDKAGITAIMEMLAYLAAHPEIRHGNIAVGFTPDEEIGNGAKYFDIEKFGADYAYTIDGDTVRGICDETFNAAGALVKFKGFSIHPGEAKNRMVNAAGMACEFQNLLPQFMTPEHTEGREGFLHLIQMSGNVEEAQLSYIIRDHDSAKLEEKKQLLKSAADYMNAKHGEGRCSLEVKNAYRNMREVIEQNPKVMERALQAMKELDIEPLHDPIRGGTDGSELSFRGLPCPNLGNGGGNFHGRYEYCVVEELEQAVQLILQIVKDIAAEVSE